MRSLRQRAFASVAYYQLANAVAGAAVILLLIQRGGALDAAPGSDISVALHNQKVKPFGLLLALKNGKLTAEEWSAQCNTFNIAKADLAAVVPPAAVVSNTT